ETLAMFADGRLRREEIAPLLAHLDTCADCRRAVESANEVLEGEREPRARWPWMAVAAAILVAIVAVPMVLMTRAKTPAARLIALAPKNERIVEPRLSGGFAYAPYEGPMRASDPATDTQRLKLAGAAGEIIEAGDAHAAGLALVLIERPEEAMQRLRAAAEKTPNDAKVWSDLAAAQYAAAVRLVRPSLFPEALASVDRALRIDANLAEAMFNRALILEKLGLPFEARKVWEQYLRIDPASKWADEARAHLAKLPTTTSEERFRNAQPRLERADQQEVDAIVKEFPQQTRAHAEVVYLNGWANGDDRQLAIARRIGDALARTSGESLLREAVRAIDGADARQRALIATAQLAYYRGRLTYSRNEPAAAEADLRRAAAGFAAANDPMALVASYFAANTRFDQNDVAGARKELSELLARTPPQFIALGAQLRWELALCHVYEDDWSSVATVAEQARAAFERLGERSNEAFMQAILADAFSTLGRPDEAWGAQIRGFELLSGEGRGDRLAIAVGGASTFQLRVGLFESAKALLRLQELAVTNDTLLNDILAREAILNVKLGDEEAAAANVAAAFAAAERIKDPALRERAVAYARFAAGAKALRSDPRYAAKELTNAIVHFVASDAAVFLPEAELLRARARLRLADDDGAAQDLESGIARLERNRTHVTGSVIGTGVLDAGTSLFQEAIAHRLGRGDAAGAFAYAERSRFRLAPAVAPLVPLRQLQQRLAGTGAAVLELVVLPDEVVAFCITADDFTTARQKLALDRLPALSERELYDILIRPSELTLARARQLIIVADRELENVPFAALYDSTTRHYLIEQMSLSLAPSASALRATQPAAESRSLVAVALPSGAQTAGLAAVAGELSEVAGSYRTKQAIAPERATLAALQSAAAGADVIHIAGHTERQPGLGDAALAFDKPVSWSTIAARPFTRASIVVLAACETLRAPRSAQARALSLGGGFLAAGASDVIGTLTPLPDEQARTIFSAIHRHLARGEDAASSLRKAQLEGLAGESAGRGPSAWRAVALITTRLPRAGF
ncbi:MAG TPA: CHAT domain-containing protein, partial [Thermoanaerobaculia bacterium]|nr:CHAT domain-containing protein [Thermoanaerobaculia bacterium]